MHDCKLNTWQHDIWKQFSQTNSLSTGAGTSQWYSAGLRVGWSGVRVTTGALFTTASRPALGPTQPPIQWVPRALSLGIKRPKREADHSPPSSAEVRNAWSYNFTLNTPACRGAQTQGQIYIYLYLYFYLYCLSTCFLTRKEHQHLNVLLGAFRLILLI
jgi:hypothetical protein